MRVVRGLRCESRQVRGRAPAYQSSSARPRPALLGGAVGEYRPDAGPAEVRRGRAGGAVTTLGHLTARGQARCHAADSPSRQAGGGDGGAAQGTGAGNRDDLSADRRPARGSPVSPSRGDSTNRTQTPTDCRYRVGEIGARASAGQSGASVAMKVRVGRYAYLWEGAEPLVPGDRVLLPESWLSRTIHGPGPFEDTVTAVGSDYDGPMSRVIAKIGRDPDWRRLETAGAGHTTRAPRLPRPRRPVPAGAGRIRPPDRRMAPACRWHGFRSGDRRAGQARHVPEVRCPRIKPVHGRPRGASILTPRTAGAG